MMRTKKITAVMLSLMLTLGAASANLAGSTVFGSAEDGDVLVVGDTTAGGWEFSDVAADNLTSAELDIFHKATDGMAGSDLEPKDVIATQTVAGTNYAFLCTSTLVTAEPETDWVIVFVYADLSGGASLTGISVVDPSDVMVKDNTGEQQSGSWKSEKKSTAAPVPDAVADALASNVGLSLSPIAVLGTQVVSGTNYSILAYGTLVTAEPVTNLYAVAVYKDLQGNAEIINIAPFDLEEYADLATGEEVTDLEDCDVVIDTEAGTVAVFDGEEEVPEDEYTVSYEGVDVDYIGDTFPKDPGTYKAIITADDDSWTVIGTVSKEFTLSDDEPLSGGWEFSDISVQAISPEEQAFFDEATENQVGAPLELRAVIATQTVAGTNYVFLGKCLPPSEEIPPEWGIATVYVDLTGKATLTAFYTVDPADVNIKDNVSEPGSGSWKVEENGTSAPVPEAVLSALSLNVGLSLSPIAVLGTQVVAGTNYRILATGTTVTAEPETNLYVVTVYESLDGTAEITDIAPFDLESYVIPNTTQPDESVADDSEEEAGSEEEKDSSVPDTTSKKENDSAADNKSTNPATGAAAAAGLGAVLLGAAVITTRKKNN